MLTCKIGIHLIIQQLNQKMNVLANTLNTVYRQLASTTMAQSEHDSSSIKHILMFHIVVLFQLVLCCKKEKRYSNIGMYQDQYFNAYSSSFQ